MNISLIFIIFTIVLFLYVAGVSVLGLFMAKKRSWIMVSVRIGVTVLAAILAIFVSELVAGLITDVVYDRVVPLLGEKISGFMTEVPVGAEGLRVIVALLIAPILYAIVFGLLRLLLMIAVWIVEKCVPALQGFVRPEISMPVGAVNGLLIAMVTLIPLCGFMTFGGHMLNTFVDADMCDTAFVQENILDTLDMDEAEISDLARKLEKNPAVIVVHKTVGKPVFQALTTAKLDTTETHGAVVKMNLDSELCGLLKTAGYATEAMGSLEKEDYTVEDKDLLFATADSFFESEWVKMLATDTLVAVSTDWLEGESFAGMARPSLDASLNPTLTCILTILSSETVDTLEEDIHDILDVVGDFLVHDLLTEDADYTELVKKLGSSGLLTDMMAKLQANERLAVLATELKSLSIRLVTNMLGVEQLKEGQYADMMGNVAGTLTDALEMSKEERDALVVESVQNAFADEGYEVPPEVVVEVTDKIVADLGEDGEITGDELTDYLVNHSDELAGSLPDGLPEDLPDELPDGILDDLPET
ncbi:MAG: hypothetical protein IJX72_06065 [Clostridia bacterium]|nr:hypothetical protein [Clostridia bacterium]